ncbi:hypothetical protein DX116_09105 [Aeromicrobium endophyticum]|uniref:Uncharacterized protein n=1 Tax=Aeromicrobium endophyticum TaxID=2292704 RepID=A0A371PCI8_9ACTN|nr:hypothetical protein DX116_09105 [Aeromicrobium endophyticum]
MRVWNRESFPEPSDDELAEYGYVKPPPKRAPHAPTGLSASGYRKVCVDCSAKIRASSTRCRACHAVYRGVVAERRPRRKDSRAHDDVDEVVVQRVLSGDWRIRTTQAEKKAVTAKWVAEGRSVAELGRLTGWRAERYLPARDAAA